MSNKVEDLRSILFDTIRAVKNPFRNEEGWIGAFTRDRAAGALANGTRIMKVNSEKGDKNPDGALGTVLGSISDPAVQDGAPFYFVEWDSLPRRAMGVIGAKLECAP